MLSFLGWHIIRIDGSSMLPSLEDGDYALARRFRSGDTPQAGDIVHVVHPQLGSIVKKIRDVPGSGRYTLIGTGIMTTPSVDMGEVAQEHIAGRVILASGQKGLRKIKRGHV